MKKRKAFTLIELMVVILIIGILAVVGLSVLRGRSDAAKWSEGKATMSTIATSLRSYAVEQGSNGTYPPSLAELGFRPGDLRGSYFVIGNYSIVTATYTPGADPQLTFTIQCDKPTLTPSRVTLDHTGTWTE